MQKTGGLIGRYGLTVWWLTAFTQSERNHIEKTYAPIGAPHALTRGPTNFATQQSVVAFLTALASWFPSDDDQSIAIRILENGQRLIQPDETDILDQHLLYQSLIDAYVRQGDDQNEDKCREACHRQIRLASKALVELERTGNNRLRERHAGFTTLQQIYSRENDPDKIRASCKAAVLTGWFTAAQAEEAMQRLGAL